MSKAPMEVLPLSVGFAVEYLDGTLTVEAREIQQQWKAVRDHLMQSAALVEGLRNSVIDECAKVAEVDHGLAFLNAKNRQAARETARLIARLIRGLAVSSTDRTSGDSR